MAHRSAAMGRAFSNRGVMRVLSSTKPLNPYLEKSITGRLFLSSSSRLMAPVSSALSKALANSGMMRMCSTTSTSSFIPPPLLPSAQQRDKPEPSTNLFISGLSKRTTTEKLREAFSQFGEVVNARVVTDRVSGYSKGFGFVKYATLEEAAKGIEGMDGKFLDGWVIFAEYARPRPPVETNNMASPPPYGRQY